MKIYVVTRGDEAIAAFSSEEDAKAYRAEHRKGVFPERGGYEDSLFELEVDRYIGYQRHRRYICEINLNDDSVREWRRDELVREYVPTARKLRSRICADSWESAEDARARAMKLWEAEKQK